MQAFAEVFKTLCEEPRLRILALLANGELRVRDLTDVLGMPQSTVSRHLAILKAARLVAGRRDGVWMHYSLAEPRDDLRRAVNLIVYGPLLDTPEAKRDAEDLEKRLEPWAARTPD